MQSSSGYITSRNTTSTSNETKTSPQVPPPPRSRTSNSNGESKTSFSTTHETKTTRDTPSLIPPPSAGRLPPQHNLSPLPSPYLRQTRSTGNLFTIQQPPPSLPPIATTNATSIPSPHPPTQPRPSPSNINTRIAPPVTRPPRSRYAVPDIPPPATSPIPRRQQQQHQQQQQQHQQESSPPPSSSSSNISTVTRKLKSTFFRKRSRFEAYEEKLAMLIRDFRVQKIKLDEELQKDLRVRATRLQTIQQKYTKDLLNLRIENEKKVTAAIHDHRMRIAQREVELQRKSQMLDEQLQVDLRRVEQSMMNNEWKMQFDVDTGRPYYVNERTQESKWYRPMDGDGAILRGAYDPSMEELREDVKCVICLDYFQAHVSQCPNGHLFCEECLTDCLNVKPSCPVCRVELHPGHATRNILAERMAKKAKRQEEAMERAAEGETPTTVNLCFHKYAGAIKDVGASHLRSLGYAKTGLKNTIDNLNKVNEAEELKLTNMAAGKRKKVQEWLGLLLQSFQKKVETLDEEFNQKKMLLQQEFGLNDTKHEKMLDTLDDKASHNGSVAAAINEDIKKEKNGQKNWYLCLKTSKNSNRNRTATFVTIGILALLVFIAAVFGGIASVQQSIDSVEDRLNNAGVQNKSDPKYDLGGGTSSVGVTSSDGASNSDDASNSDNNNDSNGSGSSNSDGDSNNDSSNDDDSTSTTSTSISPSPSIISPIVNTEAAASGEFTGQVTLNGIDGSETDAAFRQALIESLALELGVDPSDIELIPENENEGNNNGGNDGGRRRRRRLSSSGSTTFRFRVKTRDVSSALALELKYAEDSATTTLTNTLATVLNNTNTTVVTSSFSTSLGSSNDGLTKMFNTMQAPLKQSGCVVGEHLVRIYQNGTVLCKPDTSIVTSSPNIINVVRDINTYSIDVNLSHLQTKIISSCPQGTSIRKINQDGSVVCTNHLPLFQLLQSSIDKLNMTLLSINTSSGDKIVIQQQISNVVPDHEHDYGHVHEHDHDHDHETSTASTSIVPSSSISYPSSNPSSTASVPSPTYSLSPSPTSPTPTLAPSPLLTLSPLLNLSPSLNSSPLLTPSPLMTPLMTPSPSPLMTPLMTPSPLTTPSPLFAPSPQIEPLQIVSNHSYADASTVASLRTAIDRSSLLSNQIRTNVTSLQMSLNTVIDQHSILQANTWHNISTLSNQWISSYSLLSVTTSRNAQTISNMSIRQSDMELDATLNHQATLGRLNQIDESLLLKASLIDLHATQTAVNNLVANVSFVMLSIPKLNESLQDYTMNTNIRLHAHEATSILLSSRLTSVEDGLASKASQLWTGQQLSILHQYFISDLQRVDGNIQSHSESISQLELNNTNERKRVHLQIQQVVEETNQVNVSLHSIIDQEKIISSNARNNLATMSLRIESEAQVKRNQITANLVSNSTQLESQIQTTQAHVEKFQTFVASNFTLIQLAHDALYNDVTTNYNQLTRNVSTLELSIDETKKALQVVKHALVVANESQQMDLNVLKRDLNIKLNASTNALTDLILLETNERILEIERVDAFIDSNFVHVQIALNTSTKKSTALINSLQTQSNTAKNERDAMTDSIETLRVNTNILKQKTYSNITQVEMSLNDMQNVADAKHSNIQISLGTLHVKQLQSSSNHTNTKNQLGLIHSQISSLESTIVTKATKEALEATHIRIGQLTLNQSRIENRIQQQEQLSKTFKNNVTTLEASTTSLATTVMQHFVSTKNNVSSLGNSIVEVNALSDVRNQLSQQNHSRIVASLNAHSLRIIATKLISKNAIHQLNNSILTRIDRGNVISLLHRENLASRITLLQENQNKKLQSIALSTFKNHSKIEQSVNNIVSLEEMRFQQNINNHSMLIRSISSIMALTNSHASVVASNHNSVQDTLQGHATNLIETTERHHALNLTLTNQLQNMDLTMALQIDTLDARIGNEQSKRIFAVAALGSRLRANITALVNTLSVQKTEAVSITSELQARDLALTLDIRAAQNKLRLFDMEAHSNRTTTSVKLNQLKNTHEDGVNSHNRLVNEVQQNHTNFQQQFGNIILLQKNQQSSIVSSQRNHTTTSAALHSVSNHLTSIDTVLLSKAKVVDVAKAQTNIQYLFANDSLLALRVKDEERKSNQFKINVSTLDFSIQMLKSIVELNDQETNENISNTQASIAEVGAAFDSHVVSAARNHSHVLSSLNLHLLRLESAKTISRNANKQINTSLLKIINRGNDISLLHRENIESRITLLQETTEHDIQTLSSSIYTNLTILEENVQTNAITETARDQETKTNHTRVVLSIAALRARENIRLSEAVLNHSRIQNRFEQHQHSLAANSDSIVITNQSLTNQLSVMKTTSSSNFLTLETQLQSESDTRLNSIVSVTNYLKGNMSQVTETLTENRDYTKNRVSFLLGLVGTDRNRQVSDKEVLTIAINTVENSLENLNIEARANHSTGNIKLQRLQSDVAILERETIESRQNHTMQHADQQGIQTRVLSLETNMLDKANMAQLNNVITDITILNLNVTDQHVEQQAITSRVVSLETRVTTEETSLLGLALIIDARHAVAIQNEVRINNTLASIALDAASHRVKTSLNVSSLTSTIDVLAATSHAEVTLLNATLRDVLNTFKTQTNERVTSIVAFQNGVATDTEVLDSKFVGLNLTVVDEIQSRSVADEVLSGRVLALEEILTPLVYLVTHQVRQLLVQYSAPIVVANTTVTLNISGGRKGDRIAIIINTTSCAKLTAIDGIEIGFGSLATLNENMLPSYGGYKTCYALASSSATLAIRFWDQGTQNNLVVTEQDIRSIVPVNVSSSILIATSLYVFNVVGMVQQNARGYVAFVPKKEMGCLSAVARKVLIEESSTANVGRTSPGKYVVCFAPSPNSALTPFNVYANSFRRQPITLTFGVTPLTYTFIHSGNSHVVAGISSSHVRVEGVDNVQFIAFISSSSIGCTGASFTKKPIVSNMASNIAVGNIAGTTSKLCYTTSSENVVDGDFIDTSLNIPINVSSVASMVLINSLPSSIVSNVVNMFANVNGVSEGDGIVLVSSSVVGCEHVNENVRIVDSNNRVAIISSLPLGNVRICHAVSSFPNAFYDQGLTMTIVNPIVGSITIMHQSSSIVAGTDVTLSLSLYPSSSINPSSLTIGVSPISAVGCAGASTNAAAVGSNGQVTIQTPALVGIYSLCVSSAGGATDQVFLLHSIQITVVAATVGSIAPVDAHASNIVPRSTGSVRSILFFVSPVTSLQSNVRVVFIPRSVIGCLGAHNSDAILGSFIHIPPLSLGSYKLCVSSPSPTTDTNYAPQPATLIVAAPTISSASITHASPLHLVGGVRNRLSLVGVNTGDFVALLPLSESVIGCSVLSHRGTVSSSGTIDIELSIGASGIYKICHAPASANPSLPVSYIDQNVLINAVSNTINGMETSFANPSIVIRGSPVYMQPIGNNIVLNDRVAFIDASSYGCQGAAIAALPVATVAGELRIQFAAAGLSIGTYVVCIQFDDGTTAGNDGAQDINYIRQTTSINVVAPSVTSISPFNAYSNDLVTNGRQVKLSIVGSFASVSERVALLPFSTRGCLGAESISTTIDNGLNTVTFSDPVLQGCTSSSMPCQFKICYSSLHSGGDVTFSEQGYNSLRNVAKTIVGSRYLQTVASTPTSFYSFVAHAGTIVSMSSGSNVGCQGAAASSFRYGPTTCTHAKCLYTWSAPSRPIGTSSFATNSICSSTDGGSNYIEQGIGTDVVWAVNQNTPSQLGTADTNVDRVRTIHANDGMLYVVKSNGGSMGGVIKYTKEDGSGQQNLLDESQNLNEPWGFVSDKNHYYVTENGANGNRIIKYGKTCLGSSCNVVSSGNNKITYINVCPSTSRPRSIDVNGRTGISTIAYFICSSGSTSSLRSLTLGASSETSTYIVGNLPEIKDLVLSTDATYGYIACGSAGIKRITLSTGAITSLISDFNHKIVMSLSVSSTGVLRFVDYDGVDNYLALLEIDVSTETSSTTIQPKPIAVIDYSVLGMDAGTPFKDVYVTETAGNVLYLQQSFHNFGSDVESRIARVMR